MNTANSEIGAETDVSAMDALLALGEGKKILFGVPAVLCTLTAIVSLLMPATYTAKTLIMPPQQQQSTATALLEQLGPLAGMAMGATGMKNPGDLYVALLKSNAVRDNLIERFNLRARYDESLLTYTRAALSERVTISSERTGMISIEASDRDPKFAAELANAHIQAVQDVMGRLALSDAQQRRRFFEQQVDKISVKPFRDMRVQEMILASLIRQYEMARIDEAREGPLFQQVDVALPPELRSSPKRTLMVMVAGFVGLFLGAAWSLVRFSLRRAATESGASRWTSLKRAWALPWKR